MNIEKVIDGLDQLYADKESGKVEDYLSLNLEQALKEGDVGSAITIINELIGFYRDASQYDKAETYCVKLLPFMERAGLKDTIHYGTSCLNIANAYRAAGRLETSLKHYQMVFDIYEKVLDKKDFRYAGLYNNLSLLYQEMGEFDKASESLNQALLIVKEYPEAVVELAVTHTNLAASYVKAGKIDKAKDEITKGIAIFQNGLTGDYHYSAALSVSGDVYFAAKEYEQAVQCYEQAMVSLKKHVGLTHAYFRIVSNLQTSYDALKKPDALRGMTLARDYYEEFGKTAFKGWAKNWNLENRQNNIDLSELSFAKTGEGSECFGLDDILSKDHDFGPGFCVFVTREQYNQYGIELEKVYDALPEYFRGFSKPEIIAEAPRNGVIILEDFFGRILSLNDEECAFLMQFQTLPEEAWLRMEDWRLKTVTNGEIFDGRDSLFGKIYSSLQKGYPQEIQRRKIAQKLGEICQEGQYNYQRLMQRQDIYGASLMVHSFEEHVIELLFLINGVYAPHKKWMLNEAEKLLRGKKILEGVKTLMMKIPDISSYKVRAKVDWIGSTNKEDEVLAVINEIAAEIVVLLKEEGYTKSDALYLEQQIPYILQVVQ